MSLDLHQVAAQIEAMASQLLERQGEWRRRLERAVLALGEAEASKLEEKRRLSGKTLTWLVPEMSEALKTTVPCPALPADHAVLAVDGSHIDVDRHSPARCYLLNYGRVALRYGSSPEARLSSEAHLHASDEELAISDPESALRDERVEGAVLGLKRSVEEAEALASLAEGSWPEAPTVALMDGTLVLWSLGGERYRGFVKEALLDGGLLPALDRLRGLSERRTLGMASYISLPGSAEVVNALRLHACPYEAANCDQFCGALRAGERPCDVVGGVQDRELMRAVLAPGERSAVFGSTSAVVEASYREHAVRFFYVNVGEEIGRVEVPQWVAEDEALLSLVHAAVVEQCRKGLGYPAALSEAHEQAVVTGADRQQFQMLVEEALGRGRLPVYTSEKQRSKQIKAL